MSEFVDGLAPTLVALAPSFLGGFLIGRLARRAKRTTFLLTALALGLVYLAGRMGLDAGVVEAWVRNASAWAGENIDGARRSLAALLPSATAAGVGGFLGFRRKRRRS